MHSHSLFLKIRFFLLIRRRELSNSISLQKSIVFLPEVSGVVHSVFLPKFSLYTFCENCWQFSNRCQPARCAECFFSYTAAAMRQQIKRFVSSFFIFFASCASILWFSCKNRSGHFRALASCFSPRSASDAARYS